MKLYIGIDPGVQTGFATYNPYFKKLTVETSRTHKIWEAVKELSKSDEVIVYLEDARLRKWFGNLGKEAHQGAGAIKVQCTLWQQFLDDNEIAYQLVPPKANLTKLTKDQFKALTGYPKATSVHGRDAAMLVFNRK